MHRECTALTLWEWGQKILTLIFLLFAWPFLFAAVLLVFIYDGKNPFYIPVRIGKNGKVFQMIKLRTMVTGADKNGVVATAASDVRITPVGRLLRPLKVDEFFQLINVIKGDMLLVGPRPRAVSEYNALTSREREIVTVLPGISDFSSLFMAQEGILLDHYKDPSEADLYVSRPIKSRLALFYIEHRSVWVDCVLLFFNATNFISHRWTLRHMAKFIVKLGDCGVPYEVLSGEKEPYPMDLPR